MKTHWFLPLLALLAAGCTSPQKNTLTQVSAIDALLAGAYDGQMPVRRLLTHGDLGLGTFHALDGEMIVLDGAAWQARADGTVRRASSDATTPFAAVIDFAPEQTLSLEGPVDFAGLQARMNTAAPDTNLFIAVRFDGTFSAMTVRSVPPQTKPYPPLAEVTRHQPVFEYTNVTGTVLGFRCPPFVKGINVPGWHLHFLSNDRKTGGHILGFTAQNGTLRLDTCRHFTLLLPEQADFSTLDLSRDRAVELERVEK
jgi:acetolactate decarboxylase